MGAELPHIIEVTPYILLIPKNRGKLKSFLGKKFCTLKKMRRKTQVFFVLTQLYLP